MLTAVDVKLKVLCNLASFADVKSEDIFTVFGSVDVCEGCNTCIVGKACEIFTAHKVTVFEDFCLSVKHGVACIINSLLFHRAVFD